MLMAGTVGFYRSTLAALLLSALAACTPQQMLLSALVPDGAASVLLGNLRGIADANRRQVAELEYKGDWPALAAFAEHNIGRDSFSAEWRLVAGYARSQARDFERAAAHFAEMVRIAPDEVLGYQLLAEAQREAGRPERAVVTLERALQIDREPAQTWRLLGDAQADRGRHDAAVEAYRRALGLQAGMAPAWFGLGRSALRLGRDRDAAEALANLQRLQAPQAAELLRLLAKP